MSSDVSDVEPAARPGSFTVELIEKSADGRMEVQRRSTSFQEMSERFPVFVQHRF